MARKLKQSRKRTARDVHVSVSVPPVRPKPSFEGNLSDRLRMSLGADIVLTVSRDETGHTVSLRVADKVVSLTGITAIGGLSCRSVKDNG